MPEPLYTAANCRAAYQLRWSLTAFANGPIPPKDSWQSQLSRVIESDEVRLLECCERSAATIQFFLSTTPQVAPAAIVRSVKGRMQHILRPIAPKLWRRHYSLTSVGDADHRTLQNYVARQVQHHPLADARVMERLARIQFSDPNVDLEAKRSSAHSHFTYNLHIVLENRYHLVDVRPESLQATRTMLIAACQKRGWLLSRLGLVGNHLHILLGCDIADVPQEVVLSLMNNLAYAHGMKQVFESSFYLGTFGSYDHQAIRRKLAGEHELPNEHCP